MKGYSFRLQKLLDIREKKEEESKMKFKQAQNGKKSYRRETVQFKKQL